MYGHFLDIESQHVHLPVMIKRTRTGYDVIQTTQTVSKPFVKSIYYRNQYKYNESDMVKMSLKDENQYEKYTGFDDESEDDDMFNHGHLFYFTVGIIFIIYVIYT